MLTKILLITGKAQSGKDTSADYIIANSRHNCERFSFAYALKRFCVDVFGVPENQIFGSDEEKNLPTHLLWDNLPLAYDERLELKRRLFGYPNPKEFLTGRHLLQIFGTEICRRMYADCWAFNTLKRIYDSNPEVAIVTDVRFPNEINIFEQLQERFPHYLEKIDPQITVIRLLRNPLDKQHESEIALDNFDFTSLRNCKIHQIDNENLSQDQKEMLLSRILKGYVI